VVAAKPSPRIPRPATRCKLSIPWGAKRRIATARGGCGLLVLPFTLTNKRCSQPRKPSWQRRSWPLYYRGKDEAPVPITQQGPPAAAGGSHRATEALKHGPAGSRWRAYVGGSRSGKKPERGLCESLGICRR
jgi:hypothetical protein